MDRRIAAVLVALLMVSTSFVCASCDSQGAGTSDSPVFISGTEEEYRVLNADDSDKTSMTAYFSFTWISFLNPKVTIQSWTCDTLDEFNGDDPSESSIVTLMADNVSATGRACSHGISASVSPVSGDSGSNGVYAVTLTASAAADLCYYKIKVIVEENVGSVKDVQSYYYGIHMKAVTGELYSVMVQDTDGEYKNTIWFKHNTPYQSAVKTGDETFDSDSYFFYAVGLPDGINMRLNGIIEGKPAGYTIETVEGDATLYAVNKSDLSEVNIGSLHFVVLPKDSFEYAIGDGSQRISCFDDGYAAIGNTQMLKITITELNGNVFDKSRYSAKLILGDIAGVPVDISDAGVMLLNTDGALQDYTGIVQLHISKSSDDGDLDTKLHVMVVGPVVHSGLSPSVRSV